MFTGIIEQVCKVEEVEDTGQHTRLMIEKGMFDDLKIGDSISIDGVCLTVTHLDDECFTVEMINKTKKITNLGPIKPGTMVNLERALTMSTRLGGHFVSGHVDGVGKVMHKETDGSAVNMHIQCPGKLMKYILDRGSITIDGISLTLFGVRPDRSEVIISLIPETQSSTTLGSKAPGSAVNIEADMLMKHVEHLLSWGTLEAGEATRKEVPHV
ncbi:riboflavin synthase subunit alpha [Salinicoccus jeotgali]|uniref:Riboflavin synthase n=1 Tax=Salinicoccus jeotgali TaxID=381634 RepID=A0ABP7FAD4_9STAP